MTRKLLCRVASLGSEGNEEWRSNRHPGHEERLQALASKIGSER